jgi:hypothetical protein
MTSRAPITSPDLHDDKKNHDEHLEHVDGTPRLGDMHFVHMSPEERLSAFKLARELDPGPSMWSMRHFTFVMTMICVMACSCDTGESAFVWERQELIP